MDGKKVVCPMPIAAPTPPSHTHTHTRPQVGVYGHSSGYVPHTRKPHTEADGLRWRLTGLEYTPSTQCSRRLRVGLAEKVEFYVFLMCIGDHN